MVTLNDISIKTGLSVATVSHSLNNRPGYSAATRKRVRDAAKSLGYTVNPLARGLLGKSTKTVGIAWSLGRPAAGQLLQDMANRVAGHGYVTFMTNVLGNAVMGQKILADFLRRGMDGVIFQASQGLLSDPVIHRQLMQFRAAVAVTDETCESPVDQVAQDTPHAVRQLMEYWLATGRRRIGVAGEETSNGEKIRPWREMLRKFGLSDEGAVIDLPPYFPLNDHFDCYWAAFEKLCPTIDDPFPFDAVLCASDAGAATLITWLRQRGLRVPEDVAVSGVQDSEITRAIFPPLASINRHNRETSEAVESLLLRRLERPGEAVQVRIVPSTFVWRESAGLVRPTTPNAKEVSHVRDTSSKGVV